MNSRLQPPHDEPTNAEPTSAVPSPDTVAKLVARQHEFLGFLERRLGDRALAQDLLQDAFLRLDKLEALRDEESAIAWFYRVLRNSAIDHARRSQTRAKALHALTAELTHAGLPATESEVHAEVCRCVGVLKDSLKPEYRHALEAVEVAGSSVKDYAHAAGISANNAAVRLLRARKALRKQVTHACGSCAARGCTECNCAG